MRRLIVSLFSLLALSLYSVSSVAASFPCKNASSKVEVAICSDPQLDQLDTDLLAAYKVAMKIHPVEGFIKETQRHWVKDNSNCAQSNIVQCLQKRYSQRLFYLQSLTDAQFYASNRKYSIKTDDAVVEIRKVGANQYLSIWGGAYYKEIEGSGKYIPLFCEFYGMLDPKKPNTAKDVDGNVVTFSTAKGVFNLIDQGHGICDGNAALPDNITLIK